jgi:hypothetical protein
MNNILFDFTPGTDKQTQQLIAAREAAQRLAETKAAIRPTYEQQLKNAKVKAVMWEKTS